MLAYCRFSGALKNLTETRFENTNKDAKDYEVVKMIDRSHDTCQGTPNGHDGWEVKRLPPSHENHVGARLECHVRNKEDHQSNGVFVRGQFEIIRHSSDLCVSNAKIVALVQLSDVIGILELTLYDPYNSGGT